LTGSIYDHLVAIVLVGAMFCAAVAALPNVGYVSLLSVDQQQLRNVALSALNTMLLDSGYPTDWGHDASFNPASVVRFGLASANDSGLYTLDMDKVMHLVEKDEWGEPNALGFLPPATTQQLLGLQNYGFNLKILAPFNVTVKDLAPPSDLTQINYDVTVALNNGKPIPNANVNALTFYSVKATGKDDNYYLGDTKQVGITDAVGKCIITQSLGGQSGTINDVLTIMEVTVGDIHTATSVYRRGGPPNNIAVINVVGDEIILSMPPEGDPNDDRWVLSIDAYTTSGIMHLYTGVQTGPDQDKLNYGSLFEWLKSFPGLKYLDPLVIIVTFRAVLKNGGRQSLIVVGKFPNYLGNRLLSYSTGGSPTSSSSAVTVKRMVTLSGMTYTVEFTLWKLQ